MVVRFHYDIEKFRIREAGCIKRIASRIVSDAGMRPGKADLVFTSDEKLYEINAEFLGHEYYTDIITFDYNEGKTVNGEIYISVERVRENAEKLGTGFDREIRRVIFHGFLHLCGYDDSSEILKAKMTEMEDIYLALSYAE